MIGSILKLVGLSGSMGNATANASQSSRSPVLGLAAGIVGTAFPPAGIAMALLSSTGALDSIAKDDPETASKLKQHLDEYEREMEKYVAQAAAIDNFVDHMSDDQVDAFGQSQDYF